MIELLIAFGAGIVTGVVYHARLQPLVARAWAWLKGKIGPDSTGG